ncbi:MAG: hypothetical protein ABIR26_12235 [Ramlibacter sp.]
MQPSTTYLVPRQVLTQRKLGAAKEGVVDLMGSPAKLFVHSSPP